MFGRKYQARTSKKPETTRRSGAGSRPWDEWDENLPENVVEAGSDIVEDNAENRSDAGSEKVAVDSSARSFGNKGLMHGAPSLAQRDVMSPNSYTQDNCR